MAQERPSWLPSEEEMQAAIDKQRSRYARGEQGGPLTMMIDRGLVAPDVEPQVVQEKSWIKRVWKRLLCSHTHYRLLNIEYDGVSVYQCRHCSKIKKAHL